MVRIRDRKYKPFLLIHCTTLCFIQENCDVKQAFTDNFYKRIFAVLVNQKFIYENISVFFSARKVWLSIHLHGCNVKKIIHCIFLTLHKRIFIKLVSFEREKYTLNIHTSKCVLCCVLSFMHKLLSIYKDKLRNIIYPFWHYSYPFHAVYSDMTGVKFSKRNLYFFCHKKNFS